ncbi:hypothetical protein BFAG_01118 [Bacteroides fragilis 3_1_12]|uniref:Uncharacterized protein n=1 Tax=Bacteroides fragilis 3_1_12 TaxID=457424 RepID=A0ABN0BHM0_BACFG|nr:hypothetical protein BFAG_01118 [Bacteroides fragilis 3_1_12]
MIPAYSSVLECVYPFFMPAKILKVDGYSRLLRTFVAQCPKNSLWKSFTK